MTQNHHTPLPLDGTTTPVMTGELFNTPFGELDSAITDMIAGTEEFTQLAYGDGGELTIASGVVTLTNIYHNIDTESDAATDNLDTINGLASGQFAYVRANNTARTIVIRHNIGNILTVTGTNINLTDTTQIAQLFHDGTNVIAMKLGTNIVTLFSGVIRRRSSASPQTITTATDTQVTYNLSADYDTDSYVNGDTFDAPTPGKFLFTVGVRFQSGSTGIRKMWVEKNRATTPVTIFEYIQNAPSSAIGIMNATFTYEVTTGDDFELWCHHTQGSNVDIQDMTFFAMQRLEDTT